MKSKFSKEGEKQFDEIVRRYPKRDAALLPVLWLAQEEFGYLTPEAKALVSEKLDVSLARVESVVSFYTLYKSKPTGKYHVQICRNISCVLRGSEDLVNEITKKLEVGPKEVSSDQMFSFETVECIAACGRAPALQINGTYYENMTCEKLGTEMERLKRGTDR